MSVACVSFNYVFLSKLTLDGTTLNWNVLILFSIAWLLNLRGSLFGESILQPMLLVVGSSMVFLHAPIPRKALGSYNNKPTSFSVVLAVIVRVGCLRFYFVFTRFFAVLDVLIQYISTSTLLLANQTFMNLFLMHL